MEFRHLAVSLFVWQVPSDSGMTLKYFESVLVHTIATPKVAIIINLSYQKGVYGA